MSLFYIQWDDPADWPGRALLMVEGHVLRMGVCAGNSPNAVWCVLRSEHKTVKELRVALGFTQPTDVRTLERAEDGELMSRQLPLFG